MLGELRITGLGVIDDAVIEPAAGLTAVTGETGAGKTMVVTALGLACGGRGDSGRVRAGARKAVIEARFVPTAAPGSAAPDGSPAPAGSDDHLAAAADALGGDVDDDGSLLAVRSITADGRSRAHIGGRAAPVAALADLTRPLVAIHGQSEAMSLMRADTSRALLDGFADADAALADYRRLRGEWIAVREEIADRTARARERAQRERLLRLGLDEIDAAAPEPGEDTRLAADIRRLNDADALRAAATAATAALTGPPDDDMSADAAVSAVTLIESAVHELAGSDDPQLATRLDELRAASAVLTDVGADLSGYLAGLDADPARLDALLERQAVLRGLQRRYGEDIDAVLDWARAARTELADLDTSEEAVAALHRRADELADRTAHAAAQLTALRRAAADRLGRAATDQLRDLAMTTAVLDVSVTPRLAGDAAEHILSIDGRQLIAGPDGCDHVEILLTPHPNAPSIPVAKGASGGELSRIMLALEVVLAGADPVATLVFDEIDAGVGGRTATEIGRKLADIARTHQVIVVTHLAQVAAFADRQYVVDADADGSVGRSAVRPVTDGERISELARMLGGTDTAVAQAHAHKLLHSAQTVRNVPHGT